MGRMRTLVIIEAHPVIYLLTGFSPAREGMQVDALVLKRAPQPYDENVVEERPRSSIESRTPASFMRCVHAHEVS